MPLVNVLELTNGNCTTVDHHVAIIKLEYILLGCMKEEAL